MINKITIVLPIVLLLVCIIIVVCSYRKNKWDKPSIISIVITLLLAIGSIAQFIGDKYNSSKEGKEMLDNQKIMMDKQDEIYKMLIVNRVSSDNDNRFDEENNSAYYWGPEREIFTMEKPAPYVVFNSITNNPTIGDERDFVRIGEIRPDRTVLGDEVEIVPGRQYLVYVYFHNNASSTYNDSEHNHEGVAVQTTMSVLIPDVVTSKERGFIKGTISAANSNPISVWDTAYLFTTEDEVHLRYLSGTAKIYNDWKTNGSIISSSLLEEEGTLIGLNELNGVIPGCEEYHGVVTLIVEAF